jgi:hypothetical protein
MHGQPELTNVTDLHGSRDGTGSGDNDQPFSGFRPCHFSTRQLARLLHLRSELLDARLGYGRWAQDLASAC